MNTQLSIWKEESNPILRVHKYIVLSKFGYMELNTIRTFLLLLAKLQRSDAKDGKVKVYFMDIFGKTGKHAGGSQLQIARAAAGQLIERFSKPVEILYEDDDGDMRYKAIFILDSIGCKIGNDFLEVEFGKTITPLLINLAEKYSEGELRQLFSFTSYFKVRFFMIAQTLHQLNEPFHTSVDHLREMVTKDGEQYPEYKDFKKWVIAPCLKALEATAYPLDLEEVREGRFIRYLIFRPRKKQPVEIKENPIANENFMALKSYSVNTAKIEEMLLSKEITNGYIQFVLAFKEPLIKKGKIKKPGGDIYDAIIKKYLWEDYQKTIYKTPKPLKPAKPAQPDLALLPPVKQVVQTWVTYRTHQQLLEEFEGSSPELKQNCRKLNTYIASILQKNPGVIRKEIDQQGNPYLVQLQSK
jgi:plasmid replication initiation protein